MNKKIWVFCIFLCVSLCACQRKISEKGHVDSEDTFEYQSDKFADWEELDKEESMWAYDYWTEFAKERDLPYADDKVVDIVRKAYAEVDFNGAFEIGNLESYDKYKSIFLKLIENEIPFSNPETGEEVCLKDFEGLKQTGDTEYAYDIYRYEYLFFDMDEDDSPELGIRNADNHNAVYIFKYDEEKDKCFLWYTLDNYWYVLFGSRKVAWIWDGKYLAFYQLNMGGEIECETFGISNWFNEEESLHIVMLPEYIDEEKEIYVTDIMKEQGIFEHSSGRWFFRVTEEQYEELMESYWEAYYSAGEEIEKVTYTYEELFGPSIQQSAKMVKFTDEEDFSEWIEEDLIVRGVCDYSEEVKGKFVPVINKGSIFPAIIIC